MIPKKIHYCWFGGKRLPKEAIRCINSWKKFFPDYEIIEWNESNFDLNACDYVREAYENGKWAFVSDYARFLILYRHGGIYFDTDVEVLKPLDDIIEKGPYMGREPARLGGLVASGLGIAAEPGDPFYKEVLDDYAADHYLQDDGTANLTTVVTRISGLLEKHGFDKNTDPDMIQNVAGINIYPSEYFCPLGWDGIRQYTDNTYTVHLYNASWFTPTDRGILHMSMKMQDSGRLSRAAMVIAIKALQGADKIIGRSGSRGR